MESVPLLELELQGARREQAGATKRTSLPITPRVPYRLWEVWNKEAANHNAVMMWAVCCVGFLRSGEMVVSDSGSIDQNQNLSLKDVTTASMCNRRLTLSEHESRSTSTRLVSGYALWLRSYPTWWCVARKMVPYSA